MTRQEKLLAIKEKWEWLLEFQAGFNAHLESMKPLVEELPTLFDVSTAWERIQIILRDAKDSKWVGIVYHPDAQKALFAQLAAVSLGRAELFPMAEQVRLAIVVTDIKKRSDLSAYIQSEITEDELVARLSS